MLTKKEPKSDDRLSKFDWHDLSPQPPTLEARFFTQLYLYPNIFLSVGELTLLGLGLIKINDVSANFDNPRPLFILNN